MKTFEDWYEEWMSTPDFKNKSLTMIAIKGLLKHAYDAGHKDGFQEARSIESEELKEAHEMIEKALRALGHDPYDR